MDVKHSIYLQLDSIETSKDFKVSDGLMPNPHLHIFQRNLIIIYRSKINMKKDYFYKGTIFEFLNPEAYIPAIEKFILAESHEKGFVFQIICISGYNAGSISGYFREERKALLDSKMAVSYSHFIIELERNFGKIDIKTLKIDKSTTS